MDDKYVEFMNFKPTVIQSQEELHYLYVVYGGPGACNDEDATCYTISRQFATFAKGHERDWYWNENSLLLFWYLTTPQALHPYLENALPVLFRACIGIGSYPWQNYSSNRLSCIALRAVARTVREGRRETDIRLYHEAFRAFESTEHALHQPALLVLFQSIANSNFANRNEEEHVEGVCDDEIPVSKVTKVVQMQFKHNPRHYAHAKYRFKIDCTDLLPTRSCYKEGQISCSELKDLVKVLLLLVACEHGMDLKEISMLANNVKVMSDMLFDTFREYDDQTDSQNFVTWPTFQYVITTQMPFIFIGFCRLIKPLMDQLPIDLDTFATISHDKACDIIKNTYRHETKASLVASELLTYPIWCQISVITGNFLQHNPVSMRYTTACTPFLLQTLAEHLMSKSNDLLLLLSGIHKEDEVETLYSFGVHIVRSSNNDPEMCIRTIFQFSPRHSVIWAEQDPKKHSIVFKRGEYADHLTLQAAFKDTRLRCSLEEQEEELWALELLQPLTGETSFTVPEGLLQRQAGRMFSLKDLELLQMANGTYGMRSPVAS